LVEELACKAVPWKWVGMPVKIFLHSIHLLNDYRIVLHMIFYPYKIIRYLVETLESLIAKHEELIPNSAPVCLKIVLHILFFDFAYDLVAYYSCLLGEMDLQIPPSDNQVSILPPNDYVRSADTNANMALLDDTKCPPFLGLDDPKLKDECVVVIERNKNLEYYINEGK